MKLKNIPKLNYIILALTFSFISCEENEREVYLYSKPQLNATSTETSIKQGETVTYTDASTKVRALKWTFKGGVPSTSFDPSVVVNYPKGGIYIATLDITFIDNTTEKKEFEVNVEAPPPPPVVIIDGVKIYADNDNFTDTALPVNTGSWVIGANYVATKFPDDGFEGGYWRLALPASPTGNYVHAYFPSSTNPLLDITPYTYYNLAIRTTSAARMRIRMNDTSGNQAYVLLDDSNPYGLVRDGGWHMLKIPIADMKAKSAAFKLNQVKDILVLRSLDPGLDAANGQDVRNLNNCTWDIDNVYLSRK